MFSQSASPVSRPAVVLLLVLSVLIPSLAGMAPLLTTLRAAEEVTIRVSPSMAMEPANLLVQVMVERNEENRRIQVVAESSDYFASSEIQLDGEQSARVRSVTFRSLPAGSYEIRGMLFGASGRVRATARAMVTVIGR